MTEAAAVIFERLLLYSAKTSCLTNVSVRPTEITFGAIHIATPLERGRNRSLCCAIAISANNESKAACPGT